MSPVQIESAGSALQPKACVECNGEREVTLGPACSAGCGCGGRVCGVAVDACPRCEGSGVEPCDSCGEPSAIRYLAQDLCTDCAPDEDQRFSGCSICDAPIDVRESRLPLCARCEGTARVAGDQAAWASRVEREERETGRKIA